MAVDYLYLYLFSGMTDILKLRGFAETALLGKGEIKSTHSDNSQYLLLTGGLFSAIALKR